MEYGGQRFHFLILNNDVTLSDIIDPNGSAPYCSTPINPKVTIRNVGLDTIKTVKAWFNFRWSKCRHYIINRFEYSFIQFA